jgi:hypothetical protein
MPGTSARPMASAVRAEHRESVIRPHAAGWHERGGVNRPTRGYG